MSKPTHRCLTLAAVALSAFVVLPAVGQTINEDIKFIASDGAEGDGLGWSIAIDNGVVAVGVLRDDDNGMGSGSAYLFDAATGTQLFKLLASDGSIVDNFGSSIAIDNGVVAVGAFNDGGSGSAYLFDASTGTQLFKLMPSDGAPGNLFGTSIAIGNDIIAVGSIAIGDRWATTMAP